MAEAASTHVLAAPRDRRLMASQNASRYKRVCPDPTHASPWFGDQRREANSQAVYVAKRIRATVLAQEESVTRNIPTIQPIRASVARINITRAQSLRK
jgi:hypothetical protein